MGFSALRLVLQDGFSVLKLTRQPVYSLFSGIDTAVFVARLHS